MDEFRLDGLVTVEYYDNANPAIGAMGFQIYDLKAEIPAKQPQTPLVLGLCWVKSAGLLLQAPPPPPPPPAYSR